MSVVRAVRGAITVSENSREDILKETKLLLKTVIEKNGINHEDIIDIIFSTTHDLNAAFPAAAAREMGLTDVALMCTNEIDVPGSLRKCIRLMLHFNTDKSNKDIKHIYLKGAASLRPDLADKDPMEQES